MSLGLHGSKSACWTWDWTEWAGQLRPVGRDRLLTIFIVRIVAVLAVFPRVKLILIQC